MKCEYYIEILAKELNIRCIGCSKYSLLGSRCEGKIEKCINITKKDNVL